MARPAKYDEDGILKVAATIAAAKGPGAATISAISHALGAPSGSIYHRFQTRDELLGRLWLEKAAFFQNRWASALQNADPKEAGLAAALSLPRTVREDFKGARILLLHRREDFLSETWSAQVKAEAERLKEQVDQNIDRLTRRLFGKTSARARQTTTFAVLDLPFSAVRRFVASGDMPPLSIDELVTRAYKSVISTA